jgi:hypothetical protein
MKASCTCGEKAVGCVSAGGLPGAVGNVGSRSVAMHPLHRTLASIRGNAELRGRQTVRQHGSAFVVCLIEPVKTRGIAALAG